ncbi:ribosomal RNA-processing protein 7-domain-containing protein [Chytriomyces sp. MP71]|nr:ribosomal RNA-processing protein 7-domain-containing protein [Chytriomyces sp. MP71]
MSLSPTKEVSKPLVRLGVYAILPVTVSRPSGPPVTQQLLFKADTNSSATLFVANLPSDASEAHVRRLFRRCGAIAAVRFGTGLRQRRSTAHVDFEDDDSVQRCLEMRRRRRVWSDEVEDEDIGEGAAAARMSVGMEKWVQTFIANHPPLTSLEAQVNKYMKQYDDMIDARQRELTRRRAEPDEDGFILVGGAPKPKIGDDGLPIAGTVGAGANRKRKAKKTERVDFYRFQMRESKRNQLAELRSKFEEDKKRIEKLKASRRFKPY